MQAPEWMIYLKSHSAATQSSSLGVRLTLRAARSDQQADGEKVGEVTRESPKFGRSYLN